MGTRKKGSELVFNLQWRNKPDNGGDKSNVIGMYDTPTTTSNFELFKSYLLKNSGVAGNDVKVTYLTDNGQEWVIDSQEWFEIALSAFRLKARLGEVIFLKLDRVSSGRHQMIRKHSNDVETQFDLDSMGNDVIAPPEWFLTYMKQFKRDVVEEVTYAVSSNLPTNVKEKEPTPLVTTLNPKKIKTDSSKRTRKHLVFGETPIDKELLKTLKYDRKLETKLDKLDAKTKKIKEKKQALIGKIENDEHRYFGKITQMPVEETEVTVDSAGTPLFDGNAVNALSWEHMMGGEVYLHTWEVINTGKVPWSSNTELRLTWGSSDLVSSVKSLRCPDLQPGEKGTISVRFQIPKKPGTYKTYWNFYDKNVRFGHPLSCCVVVEEPLTIMSEEPFGHMKLFQASAPKIEEDKSQAMEEEPVPTKEVQEEVNKEISSPSEGFQKLVFYPDGIMEPSNAIRVTVPKNVERVICYPRGIADDVQPIMPLNIKQVDDTERPTHQQDVAGLLNSVMDLSRRIEDINLSGVANADSDSDWESVWSYGKSKQAAEFGTNKYGINETDLIVDLSMNAKEAPIEKKEDNEAQVNAIKIEDNNNNNNGNLDNNNSGGSISEIASVASSDVSSGYDVLQVPVCDEREEGSGYVYITIDGNKLPVPKHILRPDFLANAEEAPAPVPSYDENAAKQAEKLETGNEPPGRLFIFPQSHPGYEVVGGTNSPCSLMREESLDPLQNYTWSKSATQYSLADAQNPNLRSDPYGPLDQSQACTNQTSCPFAQCPYPQYTHIPNYQQSPPKPKDTSSPSPPHPKTPERPPSQGVPVHILPENLVSGAVNVASSAINTARSVINMIVPPKSEPGRWINGHWVTENPESLRAKNLCILAEMGFWDADLNATLLARYNDDIARVVTELVQ